MSITVLIAGTYVKQREALRRLLTMVFINVSKLLQ